MDPSQQLKGINELQNNLNTAIKQGNENAFVELLNEFLKGKRFREVLIDQKKINLYIKVKVIRKNPLRFCSGKSCFSNGKSDSSQNLIRTTCCAFHTYCKSCLHDHIVKSISLHGNNSVGCEACAEICLENPKKMSREEIQCFITKEEYNECLRAGISSKFLSFCKGGFSDCNFRDRPLLKKEVVEFKCCEKICKACFGLYTEAYLRRIFEQIEKTPATLNDKSLGIMCPHEHLESIKHLTLEEMNEIVSFSPSPPQYKRELEYKLSLYFVLFQNGVVHFCKNCGGLFLIQKINRCEFCLRCYSCENDFHRGLNCEEYKNIVDKGADMGDPKQKIKDSNDPDYVIFNKAIELLKNNGLGILKIINFYIPVPGGLNLYKHNLLKQDFEVKHTYLFSAPFAKQIEMEAQFFAGIPKNSEGIVELPKNFNNFTVFHSFIIYKVIYTDNVVMRRPSAQDLDWTPKIFMAEDYFYLTNEYSAIPYLIILTTPAKNFQVNK